MTTTRPGRRRARTQRFVSLDLAAFAAAALFCLAVVLLSVPVLRVVCGAALLVGISGVAGTAAFLPAGGARRGFTAVVAVVGVLLTIVEGVALDAAGIALTRHSIAITSFVVCQVLLLVAAARQTLPGLSYDIRNLGPGLLVGVGVLTMAGVAVAVASTMPRYVPTTQSSVAFAGDLARVDGVLTVPAGSSVPIAITIRNAGPAPRSYSATLKAARVTSRGPEPVEVPPGGTRTVSVGTVAARDVCADRVAVQVAEGSERYVLTLYLTATDRPCPAASL